MYRSIYKNGVDEFEEKKSKFIGYSFYVESEEEAQKYILEIKEKHRDATHNCHAYIIGEDGLIQRYSDDGEPSGTAGVPMLEVLKKEDVKNVLVIVTRYFGGTLLGAGGLVRAYTKGAKIGIDAGIIIDRIKYNLLEISYDYTNHGKILNHLMKNEYKVLSEEFTDAVKLKIHALSDAKIYEDLRDLTSGNIDIKIIREEELPTKDGKIIY